MMMRLSKTVMPQSTSLERCPLEPDVLRRQLRLALRHGAGLARLTSAEQALLAEVRPDAPPLRGPAADADAASAVAPVVVRGHTVAWVSLSGPARRRGDIEGVVGLIARSIAEAWAAADEIDSLDGEVVHAQEKLSLAHELRERLAGQLSVAVAANLALESVVNALRASWAELRLAAPGEPVFFRRAESPTASRLRLDDEGRCLTTSLRSGGQDVGTLTLARSGESEPFSSDDARLLDAVAALSAHAIRNAQLFEALQLQTTALEQSEVRLRAVVDNVAQGIITLDKRGRIESYNRAAEQIFGYRADEVIGRNFHMLLPRQHYREYRQSLYQSIRLAAGALLSIPSREIIGQRKDGMAFPMEVAVREMRNGDQPIFVFTVRDITERKQAEQALEHQALHDALTNLPNRTLFHDRLEQAILVARRENHLLGLLVMDLDRFKEINDTLGHHAGDRVLQLVSQRLRALVRDSDTVARLGGDEFAVILPAVGDVHQATKVVTKLLQGLQQPFLLEGQRLEVAASIGVTLCPEHGEDAITLLRRADVAMYVAKRNHSGYAFYASEHDRHSPGRLSLVSELRHAIDGHQLVLYFQPKVRYKTGQVTCVEALVRWQHPKYGLMKPEQFISVAEQTGLIQPLGRWVLNEALRQCHAWRELGLYMPVAVNLSMRNLHNAQLPGIVRELLDFWKLGPRWLRVEITESAIMADPERALETLSCLHEQGVEVAIDDFGTGYSSLSYLKRLRVNGLKIDKSFVQDVTTSENDLAIVRSTIELGHNLGLGVVAEGVEDRKTWELLGNLGCDEAQGYYLSRPLPPAALMKWLEESPWEVPSQEEAALDPA